MRTTRGVSFARDTMRGQQPSLRPGVAEESHEEGGQSRGAKGGGGWGAEGAAGRGVADVGQVRRVRHMHGAHVHLVRGIQHPRGAVRQQRYAGAQRGLAQAAREVDAPHGRLLQVSARDAVRAMQVAEADAVS